MAKHRLPDGIIIIYGLIDPRTNELRYVGKTLQKTNYRLRHHIRRALATPALNLVSGWINDVMSSGRSPEIFIIEYVCGQSWQDAEQFWIAYWRFVGADLLNMTKGGGATDGHRHSAKTKLLLAKRTAVQFSDPLARAAAKQKAIDQWKSPAARQRTLAAQAKYKADAGWRENMSAVRKKQWAEDIEYRRKVAAGQKRVDRKRIAKEFWQRPEYRARQAEARARRWPSPTE